MNLTVTTFFLVKSRSAGSRYDSLGSTRAYFSWSPQPRVEFFFLRPVCCRASHNETPLTMSNHSKFLTFPSDATQRHSRVLNHAVSQRSVEKDSGVLFFFLLHCKRENGDKSTTKMRSSLIVNKPTRYPANLQLNTGSFSRNCLRTFLKTVTVLLWSLSLVVQATNISTLWREWRPILYTSTGLQVQWKLFRLWFLSGNRKRGHFKCSPKPMHWNEQTWFLQTTPPPPPPFESNKTSHFRLQLQKRYVMELSCTIKGTAVWRTLRSCAIVGMNWKFWQGKVRRRHAVYSFYHSTKAKGQVVRALRALSTKNFVRSGDQDNQALTIFNKVLYGTHCV